MPRNCELILRQCTYKIKKMAAKIDSDTTTTLQRNQPICFGDKIKVFVPRKKKVNQENGGLESTVSCNNQMVSLHTLLGEDLTEQDMMFQVLDGSVVEYSGPGLQSSLLSLFDTSSELQEMFKMETKSETERDEGQTEEPMGGHGGTIYSEEKVQLQHIATKKYIAFKRNEIDGEDQFEVCLREESGKDCVLKITATDESLVEVHYGTHVTFETVDTADTVLTGIIISHEDTQIVMETIQNTSPIEAHVDITETDASANDKPTPEINHVVAAEEENKNYESIGTNEVTGTEIKLTVSNGNAHPHYDRLSNNFQSSELSTGKHPSSSSIPLPTPPHESSEPNMDTVTTSEPKIQVVASVYVEQLERHVNPKLTEVKNPKKKLLKHLTSIPTLLQDLQEELSDDAWVYDFVGVINKGHVALIELIKDLVRHPVVPNKRKNRKRYEVLKREPDYLDIALHCMEKLTNNDEGLRAVLREDSSHLYQQLGYCLHRRGNSTKTIVLQIMARIMDVDHGHSIVIRILDRFKILAQHKNRFKVVVTALAQKGNETDADQHYEVAALCFFNKVVQKAENQNKRVFYQQQILNAGFNPQDIETAMQSEDGLRELKVWQDGLIDVEQCLSAQDELRTTLAEANAEIEKIKEELKQSESQKKAIQDEHKALSLKCDSQEIEIHSIQEKLKQTQRSLKFSLTATQAQLKNINGMTVDSEDFLLLPPVVDAGTQTTITGSVSTMDKSDAESMDSLSVPTPPIAPTPPPTPPPPPPPLGVPPPPIAPPPPLMGNAATHGKKPIVPKHPLPILNWDVIRNPDGTIFEELDYENVLEKVNFTEFETLFQTQQRRDRPSCDNGHKFKPTTKQLTILENNRTRNILIAKRRLSLTAEAIRDSISDTNTETLPPEHCELLLKCIPSQQELTDLDKHADQVDGFGEAEQFVYHLAQIDSYESKLRCMAYIGNFDDLVNAIQPQIDVVQTAAESVLNSKKLHQLFEIILAFGNYMNSSKRGIVLGFRLKSLLKMKVTKSLDRKQTLLHYIAHTVQLFYPEVLLFHEELKIEEACKVSTSMIQEDMGTLKEGLERCKQEGENEKITSFCQQATVRLEKLSTSYKEMTNIFEKTSTMFGEHPRTATNSKGIDYSEFFGMFASFITDWKAVVQANRNAALRGATHSPKHPSSLNKTSMASVADEVALQATARASNFVHETKRLDESQDLSRPKNTKRGSGVVLNRQSDIGKHIQKFNKPLPQQRSPFRRRKT